MSRRPTDVVQAPNDKRQVEPMLEKIEALPEELGKVKNLLADAGYFSADNVEACEKAGVLPVIAMESVLRLESGVDGRVSM